MEVLDIKGDELSPTIILNHIDNIYSITGESRPENPLKFYDPAFKWFNDYFTYMYVLNDLENTKVQISKNLKIDLDYFNSTSAKVLFDLFTLLSATGKDKFNLNFQIDWHYDAEDLDMLDAGKEMETMCSLKFNYHPKK